jgi:hypothetical protein
MTTLRLLSKNNQNQNLILEKLQHEAIQIHSTPGMFYIPRNLFAEDKILGEDRLSTYEHAYPVDLYVESFDGFTGQNAFASKFGLQIDSQAVFQISKLGWANAVGKYGTSILPNRPSEGDLIYADFSKGLFEIKFVDHQAPFYQLGQFYTYKLNVELFVYSSERMNTDTPEINEFEDLLSQSKSVRSDPGTAKGAQNNRDLLDKASTFIVETGNPFGSF